MDNMKGKPMTDTEELIYPQCEGCRCDGKVTEGEYSTEDDVSFCTPCWIGYLCDTLKEKDAEIKRQNKKYSDRVTKDMAKIGKRELARCISKSSVSYTEAAKRTFKAMIRERNHDR